MVDRFPENETWGETRARLNDLAAAPSLAAFGIRPSSSDVSTAVQDAIFSAFDAGDKSMFVPPGLYLLDRQNTIVVPEGMTIFGVNGQSYFKGVGTIGARPAFPLVGGSMFALGRRDNKNRYATETGRVASGSGATFNVTVSGGAVTAATVASGGTGYKTNDYINLANGTRLVVSAVSSYRGPVTSVTIDLPGSGWGSPANPVSQVSSQGRAAFDRILDPATFASYVSFIDLVIDGDYGFDNPMLTGSQFYAGIDIRGAKDLLIQGCRAYRFPNTAFLCVDCKRGRVFDNVAEDCGWRGVFGTSRNGFSNTGVYVTSNGATLNTDNWQFMRNVARDIGDVGAQFAFIGDGQIRSNSFTGCGTIAIEGEAAVYAVADTFANNGGVVIPADVIVAGNDIDGTMLNGHLATTTTVSPGSYTSSIALDAIAWASGNEGRLEFRGNTMKNIQRRGIHASQTNNGSIVIENNEADFVNTGSARLQVIMAVAEQTRVRSNRVRNSGAGTVILIENRGLDIVCEDNEIYGVGPASTPVIMVAFFRTITGRLVSISRNKLHNFFGPGIQIENSGSSSNTMRWRSVRIDDNQFVDGNRDGNITHRPYVVIATRNGALLNIDLLTIDGNSMAEGTVRTSGTNPLIQVNNGNSVASNLVSISRNRAPQFGTLYSVSPTIAPLATAYAGNA